MRLLVDALLKKDPNARPCMDDVMGLIFVRTSLKAYASHCCLTTARRRSSHARSLTPYRLWAVRTCLLLTGAITQLVCSWALNLRSCGKSTANKSQQDPHCKVDRKLKGSSRTCMHSQQRFRHGMWQDEMTSCPASQAQPETKDQNIPESGQYSLEKEVSQEAAPQLQAASNDGSPRSALICCYCGFFNKR